jgi:protein TonB
MHSATLPYTPLLREPAAATAAPWLTAATPSLQQPATPAWRRYRGVLISSLLHAAVVLLAWTLAASHPAPKAVAAAVELIHVAPPKALAPPPPPPKPAEPQAKPVSLAPPRPVSAAVPQPRTVAAPAASAETTASPATPLPATPIGPVTPAVAAPAPTAAKPAPPVSKVVSTEGIPTDYVNQVYARINRNTDYPQAARQRRQQGKVAYVLTLDQQGALLKVEIQGSGVEALDEAARQAIERAAPFPKLPDLGGSSYLLAGNIVFKLN